MGSWSRPCLDFDHIGQNWEHSNTLLVLERHQPTALCISADEVQLGDIPPPRPPTSNTHRHSRECRWVLEVSAYRSRQQYRAVSHCLRLNVHRGLYSGQQRLCARVVPPSATGYGAVADAALPLPPPPRTATGRVPMQAPPPGAPDSGKQSTMRSPARCHRPAVVADIDDMADAFLLTWRVAGGQSMPVAGGGERRA